MEIAGESMTLTSELLISSGDFGRDEEIELTRDNSCEGRALQLRLKDAATAVADFSSWRGSARRDKVAAKGFKGAVNHDRVALLRAISRG
jgi:hypothetical protein